MLTKNLLFKFAALLLVAVTLVGLSASSAAAQNDTWQPKLPPSGKGSVVFINHNGTGQVLLVDLDGTLYTVSEKVNDIPGRLQIDLAPGTHVYTVSVAHIGTVTRTIEVVAGRVIDLSFVADRWVDAKCDPADEDDEDCEDPAWNLVVYQEDVTSQAR